MSYCESCGTELGEGATFCSSCGEEVNREPDAPHSEPKPDSEPEPEESRETAPCQKCDSKISTNADKCPQCGFEPASNGILGSLLALICIPWMGIGLLFYLGAIAALVTGGYSIGGFIAGMLLITVFVAFPASYLFALFSNAERKPTEPVELFGREL